VDVSSLGAARVGRGRRRPRGGRARASAAVCAGGTVARAEPVGVAREAASAAEMFRGHTEITARSQRDQPCPIIGSQVASDDAAPLASVGRVWFALLRRAAHARARLLGSLDASGGAVVVRAALAAAALLAAAAAAPAAAAPRLRRRRRSTGGGAGGARGAGRPRLDRVAGWRRGRWGRRRRRCRRRQQRRRWQQRRRRRRRRLSFVDSRRGADAAASCGAHGRVSRLDGAGRGAAAPVGGAMLPEGDSGR